MNNFGYVILGFANDSDVPKFLALDSINCTRSYQGGGYPYWSTNVNVVKVYTTRDAAQKMLESSDFVA